jgi:hypothetical protein
MKMFENLNNSKNMVFNGKKLLNDGVDLIYGEEVERSNPSRMSGRCCGLR